MAEERIFLLGDFRLDVGQRRLSQNGQMIHLTNLPYQVLVYLIEHRHRLVTRNELLDRFWEGKDVYGDALRKTVGAIRKALGDRQDHPRFIETRWAEGYRYIGPLIEKRSMEESGDIVFDAPISLQRESFIPAEEKTRAEVAGVQTVPIFNQLSQPETMPMSPLARHSFWQKPFAAATGLAVMLVALLIAVSAFYRSNNRGLELAAAPIRSLAVLPLKNLTGDPTQDYFGDGVTESLINELAKVRDLKVIARNSAFAFKGKEVDVREIGRRLGVATLLEGSLRRDAETVRVTVRLISTEDGRVLWTGDTTRPLKEIIAVQDEIGCSVAESLKAVLCRDPNHKPGTNNLAAYDAYLKAREQRLKGDPQKAADFYQQAVNADPNYALGWAGLAEAYTVMEVNSLVPPRTVVGQARESALKAITLEPALAAPYAALGLLTAFSDRDWMTGERYLQQALAINPNYAIAHAWYANTLMVQGKFAEAEATYLRARELDPLNPGFLNNLAETYHYWRRPDRCLAQAAKALELDPANEWARFNQVKCFALLGRYEEALQVPLAAQYKNFRQATVFALSNRQAEARKLLPLVVKDFGQISPFVVAVTYTLLGEKETAFAWLQKAADAQQADLVSLKVEPAFDSLRADPRFAELLRRVGLAP